MMNRQLFRNNLCRAACLAIGLLLATGCSPSQGLPSNASTPAGMVENAQITAAPSPSPPPAPTAVATQEAPVEIPSEGAEEGPAHRIGVRVVDGTGEFYDRETGEKFIPRGFNYVRIAPMGTGAWHSTLNPGLYEPERAGEALLAMHAGGYNVVRVFVDCCRKGSNAGSPRGGVSEPYLLNVIDFLQRAAENEIYVLLVLDLTPAEGGYDDMWQHCCTTFDGENLRYLTPGGHRGERRFNQDFIRALIAHDAPMEAIFAYDLTNEVHFSVDKPPFSMAAGKVRTANGLVYDMANPDDKTRMMDENLVYWIDQQRAAILEVDPNALVTVSFPGINSGQTTVHTGPAIRESTADFIDLHIYLGWGLSLEEYLRRFEVEEQAAKPVILGEFGASSRAYPDVQEAVRKLVELQAASCGYGFDGWLLWTWDTEDMPDLWTGMRANGEISAALAPLNRRDPCESPNDQ